jgi:hypothetical protein
VSSIENAYCVVIVMLSRIRQPVGLAANLLGNSPMELQSVIFSHVIDESDETH